MPARKVQTRASATDKSDSAAVPTKRKVTEGGKTGDGKSDATARAAKRKVAVGGKAASEAKASKKKSAGAGKSEAKAGGAKRKAVSHGKSGAARVRPDNAAESPDAKSGGKAAKQDRKPVRDSFTMPAADFALIARLKARTLEARRETKKSELLRAGLHALEGLDLAALVHALDGLTPIKVGRPSKRH